MLFDYTRITTGPSTRAISRQFGMTYSTARKVIQKILYIYLYEIGRLQTLSRANYDIHVWLWCYWLPGWRLTMACLWIKASRLGSCLSECAVQILQLWILVISTPPNGPTSTTVFSESILVVLFYSRYHNNGIPFKKS